jgi:hypothetical protein
LEDGGIMVSIPAGAKFSPFRVYNLALDQQNFLFNENLGSSPGDKATGA